MQDKFIDLKNGFQIIQYKEGYEEFYCSQGYQLTTKEEVKKGRCQLCDEITKANMIE